MAMKEYKPGTQRPVHRPRRHGLRPARLLRQPHPNSQPRFARSRWAALHEHAHDSALFPTRSCILTGRNHHSNHMAAITEVSTGFPGYDGHIPFENGFLSEILLGHGYNTFAVGKWHLTPADQISAAGPYDR